MHQSKCTLENIWQLYLYIYPNVSTQLQQTPKVKKTLHYNSTSIIAKDFLNLSALFQPVALSPQPSFTVTPPDKTGLAFSSFTNRQVQRRFLCIVRVCYRRDSLHFSEPRQTFCICHVIPSFSNTCGLHNSLCFSAGERLVTYSTSPKLPFILAQLIVNRFPSLFASSLCLFSSCLHRITAGVISAIKSLEASSFPCSPVVSQDNS